MACKILIVDDDKNILFAMKIALEKDGYKVFTAESAEEGIPLFEECVPDVVFLDITMPGKSGLDMLADIRDAGYEVPVIVMTGYGTMNTAIESYQLKAFDYVNKPLDLEEIRSLAAKGSSFAQLQNNPDNGNEETTVKIEPYEIIGTSEKIQKVFKKIGLLINTPITSPILISGESGTGKELVARAIHFKGAAKDEPFIPINCAAVPEQLLESELFGYTKGAFTGAETDKIGKFEAVGKGTIFLDELAEMPFALQAKLLRVIEERKFQRIGSNDDIEVKGRFIAATNKKLKVLISEKKFREDLYFRLNVLVVELPPLRDRVEDIKILGNHFVCEFAKSLKKGVSGISDGALNTLNKYDYPGNVRELKNILERAVLISKSEKILDSDIEHLMSNPRPEESPAESKNDLGFVGAKNKVVHKFEKEYVVNLIKKTEGNISKAARLSGMSRPTLYKLFNEYAIDPSDYKL